MKDIRDILVVCKNKAEQARWMMALAHLTKPFQTDMNPHILLKGPNDGEMHYLLTSTSLSFKLFNSHYSAGIVTAYEA